jgi:hypothetical protein
MSFSLHIHEERMLEEWAFPEERVGMRAKNLSPKLQ